MAPGNIKVVVRVRPFNGREIDRNAKNVVQMKGNQTILVPPPEAEERLRKGGMKGADGQKTFAFDKSYWSFDREDPHFAGQQNVFQDLGKPLLDNAFQGYNNCIFAYGQTGSGKSYSMMGFGEEAGVIPRICKSMFERISDLQKDKNLKYTVEVSYLEIYNERVRDLLNPANKGNLKVREHPSTGPYVEDLAKLAVQSFEEIEHLMDEGNKARTVAATNMNETSSRSHAVFTLTVTQKRHDEETRMDTEKVAKISLVDLAGSERATSTGATGARLKEGAEINRSLSTLGRVIAALADLSTGKKKNMSMVPYRDSVLTWLLKDSLGGNSMTAMIAAISPADINFEETLSTLRYADSAKRIKNHAVVNEDPNARMIRELKEELAQLRSKLSGGGSTGGAAQEQYAPDTPLDKQIVSITQADGTVKRVSKADIAEQLNQSQKLYEDLNQTWEQKLEKTEHIHKEREAALEELGISIEKGFVGVSTPKRMPHLVNLSDDPLLAECLVYNLKPGTTAVGNVEDPSSGTEIRLNGSKILKDHCTFENVDGLVTLVPKDGASIMVNGLRIEKPTRLRSGNRIILGDFHIFRFNHPQEAREELKEQSLLQSVTTSHLGSPAPRPIHGRTRSKLSQEIDGDDESLDLASTSRSGKDSEWSNARREAAGAILGQDQKINHLTDDELDALFDDVQRARAVRKGHPESRLNGHDDEDLDSVNSYPVREKNMSNGTSDNFSLDTALTLPSTPIHHGFEAPESEDGRLEVMRDDMQAQLDKQKDQYEEKIRAAEHSSQTNAEELKAEKERMEHALEAAKQEYQQQLEQQKATFIEQMREASNSPSHAKPRITMEGLTDLPEEEKKIARSAYDRWRQISYVRLAEAILRNAATLKEAQVMSHVMDKHVSFQFTIVREGQDVCSSYDLVLSGISGDEDPDLELATKPCVAIRVMDFRHTVIHLWSLPKLEQRVRTMRQMQQYLNRPDYLQHFRLENPFVEAALPQFSLIGEANIALTAVFEARVQDYSVEVISTYTLETIGFIKLSLEPSSAQAPASSLKFNVVMHELIGFAEREGTELHGQMFIPGISEEGGATTTQMIRDFDEDPVRFESVHSMTIPRNAPRDVTLRVAIYARVTAMHLDKILSWDEIREIDSRNEEKEERQAPRLPESEYWISEEHDVFAKAKILEMSETGEYRPVEIEQQSNLDPGTCQLHQGLQRRIMLNIACSSSESLQWKEIKYLKVGDIRLVDAMSSGPDHLDAGEQIALKLIQEPVLITDANGVKEITVVGQWDSSLHGSYLLDRPTAERHSVKLSLSVAIVSSRVKDPMVFQINQVLQIHPRSWLRPQSLFKQLWKTTRVVNYTSHIFSVVMKPAPSQRAMDLWRMDSHAVYVKGEEDLGHWKPRGTSLVRDFALSQGSRKRRAEVEAMKVYLRRSHSRRDQGLFSVTNGAEEQFNARQHDILDKSLSLWRKPSFSALSSNLSQNLSSRAGKTLQAVPAPAPPGRPSLASHVHAIPKNPECLKSSYLLTPSSTAQSWTKHFAEFRPPYLHLYAVPSGSETAVINLRNARIDLAPEVQRIIVGNARGVTGTSPGRVSVGNGKNVWAVYTSGSSWLFMARSEEEKSRWVLAIDGGLLGDPEEEFDAFS